MAKPATRLLMLALAAVLVVAVDLVAYYYLYSADLPLRFTVELAPSLVAAATGLLFFLPQLILSLLHRRKKPYIWTWFWLGGLMAVHQMAQPIAPFAARATITEHPPVAWYLQAIFIVGYAVAVSLYLEPKRADGAQPRAPVGRILVAAAAVTGWLSLWGLMQQAFLSGAGVMHLVNVNVLPASAVWSSMSEPLSFARYVVAGLLSGALLALPAVLSRLRPLGLYGGTGAMLLWVLLFGWLNVLAIDRLPQSYLASTYTAVEVGFALVILASAVIARLEAGAETRAPAFAVLYALRVLVLQVVIALLLAVFVLARYSLVFKPLAEHRWF